MLQVSQKFLNLILNKYGMNLQNRAEDISYEIFVEIANIL